MNKWAVYWMLHCIGAAGWGASFILLPHKLLPAILMGALGAAWFFAFMALARRFVRNATQG